MESKTLHYGGKWSLSTYIYRYPLIFTFRIIIQGDKKIGIFHLNNIEESWWFPNFEN